MNIYNTNATNPDTDGDSVSDGDEVNNGTDPLDPNCLSPTGWADESTREAEPDRCWRNSEEREEYLVTIEREDDNVRTMRTFVRQLVWPGWFTIRIYTTFHHLNLLAVASSPAPLPVCPPHSPDYIDDLTHSYGHNGVQPAWSPNYYGPPTQNTPTVLANTFGTFGNDNSENNHLWIYEWDANDGWDWRCVGSSIGHN